MTGWRLVQWIAALCMLGALYGVLIYTALHVVPM